MILGILKERVDYLSDDQLKDVGIETLEELVWDINFHQARTVLKTGISDKGFKRLVENLQISDYLTECMSVKLKEKYKIDQFNVLKMLLQNGRMEFFTATEIRAYQDKIELEFIHDTIERKTRIIRIMQDINKIGNRRLRAALDAENNLRIKMKGDVAL